MENTVINSYNILKYLVLNNDGLLSMNTTDVLEAYYDENGHFVISYRDGLNRFYFSDKDYLILQKNIEEWKRANPEKAMRLLCESFSTSFYTTMKDEYKHCEQLRLKRNHSHNTWSKDCLLFESNNDMNNASCKSTRILSAESNSARLVRKNELLETDEIHKRKRELERIKLYGSRGSSNYIESQPIDYINNHSKSREQEIEAERIRLYGNRGK